MKTEDAEILKYLLWQFVDNVETGKVIKEEGEGKRGNLYYFTHHKGFLCVNRILP